MRYIVFVFISFIYATTLPAQIFSKEAFHAANGKWAIGIVGGGLGIFEDKARGVFGLNLTIKGVYVDFMGKGSSHKSDVKVDKWEEASGTVFHVGYQLPVTKGLRLIPLVGYYTLGSVATNGYDWEVTRRGISNKTSNSVDSKGIDYGCSIVFNTKHVNFYAAGTKHTLYGGIAYQF